jgi:hypothetical protein
MPTLGCRGLVLLIMVLPVMAPCFAVGQETPGGWKVYRPNGGPRSAVAAIDGPYA